MKSVSQLAGLQTWIALLRGINVGGKNKLSMKDLALDLESLDLKNVATYIQSGNVVFQSSRMGSGALGDRIAAKIEQRHGFRPQVLVIGAKHWKAAMEGNPFPEAEAEPKSLHLYFLASAAKSPDMEALSRMTSSSERFQLAERVFYLHAPGGVGRSKLAAGVEKCLGVAATARNWRTVQKLWEMAQDRV